MKAFKKNRGAADAFMQWLIILTFVVFAAPTWAETEISFDGLERIEGANVGAAYIHPDVDFSVFQRVTILDPYIAFRENWQRDQRRTGTRLRISDSGMERIKGDVANLFRDVFVETLEADNGFEVVSGGGSDVLLIRPAIIDLDITAPDISSAGRSRTYVASTGQALLYIEMFDSVTGQIVGRALDRQVARRAGGNLRWTNRVTNMNDGRRMMRGWAEQLREFLEQHYVKAADKTEATE